MFEKFTRTFKHTLIYSLGNISTTLVGVILLPLYTKYLSLTEYGILGILEVTIMLLINTLIMGQSQALLRYYDSTQLKQNRKSLFFTILVFVSLLGITLILVAHLLSAKIANFFSKPEEFTIYFQLTAYIVSLRIITQLFLTLLRAKENSFSYVFLNILRILISLVLNIYFVAWKKFGVVGILYSYLIADSVLFLALLIILFKDIYPKFERKILIASLAFGTPLIINSLASMMLNMGDRYILKLLADYRELGLYVLGYKIGGLVNIFLVQSFSLGFMPIAYRIYGQEGDKRYFSKIQTYICFVLFWCGLLLASFSKEIVRFFALNESYWPAYQVIPVVALSYGVLGAKIVAGVGLFLKNKTSHLAYTTIFAAIINIILNFLFIPHYKMMGAAYATLISFTVLYVLTAIISHHYYPIAFENDKLLKLLILAILLYFLSYLADPFNLLLKWFFKLVLVGSYPIILYFLGFYEQIELQRIKQGINNFLR
jgi:O-antigen/teichoic acid export membrane protein